MLFKDGIRLLVSYHETNSYDKSDADDLLWRIAFTILRLSYRLIKGS